jgi:hypothetical protein
MVNLTPIPSIQCSISKDSQNQLVVEVCGDKRKTLTLACEIFKKDNWWSKIKQFMGYTTKINVLDDGVSKQVIVKTKDLISCLNEAKSNRLTRNEALSVAARIGTLDMVKKCLQPKANYLPSDNAVEMVELKSKDTNQEISDAEKFKTALAEAVKSGHVDIVNLLLEKVGVQDEAFIKRALTEAIKSGHREVVELLLEKVRVQDKQFIKESFVLASMSGNKEVLKIVLEKFKDKITPEIFGEAFAKASAEYMSPVKAYQKIPLRGDFYDDSFTYRPIAGCAGFLQEALPGMNFRPDQNKDIIKKYLIESMKTRTNEFVVNGVYLKDMVVSLFGSNGMSKQFPDLLGSKDTERKYALVEIYKSVFLEAANLENPPIDFLDEWSYVWIKDEINGKMEKRVWFELDKPLEVPDGYDILGTESFEFKLQVLKDLEKNGRLYEAKKIILAPGVFFEKTKTSYAPYMKESPIGRPIPEAISLLIKNIIKNESLKEEELSLLLRLLPDDQQFYKEALLHFVSNKNASAAKLMLNVLFKMDPIDYESENYKSIVEKVAKEKRKEFDNIVKGYHESCVLKIERDFDNIQKQFDSKWYQFGLRQRGPLYERLIGSMNLFSDGLQNVTSLKKKFDDLNKQQYDQGFKKDDQEFKKDDQGFKKDDQEFKIEALLLFVTNQNAFEANLILNSLFKMDPIDYESENYKSIVKKVDSAGKRKEFDDIVKGYHESCVLKIERDFNNIKKQFDSEWYLFGLRQRGPLYGRLIGSMNLFINGLQNVLSLKSKLDDLNKKLGIVDAMD